MFFSARNDMVKSAACEHLRRTIQAVVLTGRILDDGRNDRTPHRRRQCSMLVILAGMASMSLWTSGARAQAALPEPQAVAQEQFVCHLPGASDRWIGIYRPVSGPQRCRVDYTRDGKTRSLWSSGRHYEYCVRKALEIVGLLEGVNFKCSPQTKTATEPAPTR
jgi:hypothetical protein